jgi:hypothetical protein
VWAKQVNQDRLLVVGDLCMTRSEQRLLSPDKNVYAALFGAQRTCAPTWSPPPVTSAAILCSGALDGHGACGHEVSAFVQQQLPQRLKRVRGWRNAQASALTRQCRTSACLRPRHSAPTTRPTC